MSINGSGNVCACRIPLYPLHVPQLAKTHTQIALPPRIAWIAGCQILSNPLALLERDARSNQISLRQLNLAELLEAQAQIALPPGVARIAGHQLLGNLLALLEGAARSS